MLCVCVCVLELVCACVHVCVYNTKFANHYDTEGSQVIAAADDSPIDLS